MPLPAAPLPRAPIAPDNTSTPYEVLLGELDKVIAEWRALIESEPWAALPSARLIDSMPEILAHLIRRAHVGALEVDDDLKARITGEHGVARREDAVPLVAVAEEWAYLKRACWQTLARQGVVEGAARVAMQRLDVLFDDAIGYTLRGYYQPELDALKGIGLERRDGATDRRRGPDNRRDEPVDG